jgi:nucleoside-diphosphate kinase
MLIKHKAYCVTVQVWEGHDIVVQARRITGETDPLKSTPGSIRGDYAIELAR